MTANLVPSGRCKGDKLISAATLLSTGRAWQVLVFQKTMKFELYGGQERERAREARQLTKKKELTCLLRTWRQWIYCPAREPLFSHS